MSEAKQRSFYFGFVFGISFRESRRNLIKVLTFTHFT